MNGIIINPGAGPVESGAWEQAHRNVKRFIQDCEVPMHIVRSDFTPDDGRYMFVLEADDFPLSVELEMPGLPLEEVRYMGDEGQNPFNFPRLYMDGSSWLWKFGIITKEYIREFVNDKISSLKSEIRELEHRLAEMEE